MIQHHHDCHPIKSANSETSSSLNERHVSIINCVASHILINIRINLTILLCCSLLFLLCHIPLIIGGGTQILKDFDLNTPAEPEKVAKVTKLPYWFDYDWFKNHYQKIYGSVEASLRRSIFTARCLQVFRNNIQYRLGLITYESGINDFSDWTPEEYKSMFMKRPASDEVEGAATGPDQWELEEREIYSQSSSDESLSSSSGMEINQMSLETARDSIEQMLNDALNTGALEQLEAIEEELASKPPTLTQISQSPLSWINTIISNKGNNNGNNNALDNSNIDLYQVPPMPAIKKKRTTMRRTAQNDINSPHEPITGMKCPNSVDNSNKTDEIKTFIRPGSPLYRPVELPEDIPMMNWSLHECFHEVYNQGKKCGQCYVLAGTALAEFYKCAETEQMNKRKFSKNYIINCAQNFSPRNYGCDGGSILDVMNFIAYSGVYTVKDWKDKLAEAKQQNLQLFNYDPTYARCPIDKHTTPLEDWGKIKIDITPRRVWPAHWMKYIRSGPMAVIVSMPKGSFNYKRGVHMGEGCATSHNWHSMILVGYGRENGQDFWLFRNSWGPDWGEQGHFKLSTHVPHECLHKGVRLIREPWYPFQGRPDKVIDYMSLAESASKE